MEGDIEIVDQVIVYAARKTFAKSTQGEQDVKQSLRMRHYSIACAI